MKETNNQDIDTETIEEFVTQETDESANLSEDELSDTANESALWQDRFIRLSAEFDNYRKRTLKEKMELINSGGSDVLKAIISTADDFDRALAVIQEGPDREGVKLIYTNFMNALSSKGVTEIDAQGKKFDVDHHEAIAKIPAGDELTPGTIVDVIQKGYMLKDKVLRFAKVVVAE